MELFGFLLKLVEATLGIGIDGILGVFTDVELDLELLRGTHDALLKTLETHDGVWGEMIVQGRLVKEEKKEGESRRKCQGRGEEFKLRDGGIIAALPFPTLTLLVALQL
jgi:hypothetical protein